MVLGGACVPVGLRQYQRQLRVGSRQYGVPLPWGVWINALPVTIASAIAYSQANMSRTARSSLSAVPPPVEWYVWERRVQLAAWALGEEEGLHADLANEDHAAAAGFLCAETTGAAP